MENLFRVLFNRRHSSIYIFSHHPPPSRPLPPTLLLLLLLGESSPSSGTDLEQTTAMSGVLQKRTSSASSPWTAQWENKLKLAYVSIHRILRIVVNEWTSEPPTEWVACCGGMEMLCSNCEGCCLLLDGWRMLLLLDWIEGEEEDWLSEAHCWELYFIDWNRFLKLNAKRGHELQN